MVFALKFMSQFVVRQVNVTAKATQVNATKLIAIVVWSVQGIIILKLKNMYKESAKMLIIGLMI